MKILLLIMIFLFMGIFFIISNNNLSLSENGNIDKIVKEYKNWLSDLGDNVLKISANVVKMNWIPER